MGIDSVLGPLRAMQVRAVPSASEPLKPNILILSSVRVLSADGGRFLLGGMTAFLRRDACVVVIASMAWRGVAWRGVAG